MYGFRSIIVSLVSRFEVFTHAKEWNIRKTRIHKVDIVVINIFSTCDTHTSCLCNDTREEKKPKSIVIVRYCEITDASLSTEACVMMSVVFAVGQLFQ